MRIRTFAELTTADERTLRFTPLGLATGGMLTPQASAKFQQQSIADADLAETVPEGTRNSFDRIRLFHSYGVLCYDLFTLTDDLTWIVLEQALRERFIEFYGGQIRIVDQQGTLDTLPASDFEAVSIAFRRGGSHAGQWLLKLEPTGTMQMPLTLTPLLKWARREKLLDGQRNRRLQLTVFPRLRNHFAHGAGYRLGMPNESARAVRDLAEIINRLWGASTPGGRIYPAPLDRQAVVLTWSPGWGKPEVGSTFKELRPDDLADRTEPDWTYLIVLAPAIEHELSSFDARYDLTTYPTELLWGPGTRDKAIAWLQTASPAPDQVPYLDRLFAIRRDEGKAYLPCRPERLLSLPEEQRPGRWDLVRADFPMDAFGHVRHLQRGEACPNGEYGGCPVEEVAQGSWAEIVEAARAEQPNLRPAAYSTASVPRLSVFGDDVGY